MPLSLINKAVRSVLPLFSCLLIIVILVCYLPYLNYIILSTTGHHESLIGIPADVTDLACVTSMHEQEFWRSILLFLFALWLIHSGQIPDHDTTVSGGRGKEVGVELGESHLVYFMLVLSEGEQLALQVSGVPHCH